LHTHNVRTVTLHMYKCKYVCMYKCKYLCASDRKVTSTQLMHLRLTFFILIYYVVKWFDKKLHKIPPAVWHSGHRVLVQNIRTWVQSSTKF
jgi:hypothetical protein